MAYGRRDQYLDTFLGTSLNDNNNLSIGALANPTSMTYVPGTGSVDNMTSGNPNNPDTRYNPKAIAANNLTGNNNANIDAAYADSPFAVNVEAQRRPQVSSVDIKRYEPSISLPEKLGEVSETTDTYKKLLPMADTTAGDIISKYGPGGESAVPKKLGETLGSKIMGSEIGQKAKSMMSSEFASKALAFSPLIGAISNYKAQGEAINNLESARNDAMGALSGLSESREADLDSTREQYSEDVRRIGALENQAMGQRIEKIQSAKTGGLVSGTQTEMTQDTIDQSRTKTDITIAKLADQRAATEARLLSANKQERQKLNQTIAQLDAKIDEANRSRVVGPIKAAVDVGSNLLMASNPALAIGMQVGKSLIS